MTNEREGFGQDIRTSAPPPPRILAENLSHMVTFILETVMGWGEGGLHSVCQSGPRGVWGFRFWEPGNSGGAGGGCLAGRVAQGRVQEAFSPVSIKIATVVVIFKWELFCF